MQCAGLVAAHTCGRPTPLVWRPKSSQVTDLSVTDLSSAQASQVDTGLYNIAYQAMHCGFSFLYGVA